VDISLFADEATVAAEQEQAEQVFQMLGVHVALGRKVPSWRSFADRFPWLLCNIGGGILCAIIADRYTEFLNTTIILALFIPVVLALSESVSMQSMTLTVLGLEHQGLKWRHLWKSLRKEFVTATLLGICCGAIVGSVAYLWKSAGMISFAIGSSICMAMITACLLGVAIPAGIRALRGNPNIASGPIVLAIADVATLTFYFNLALWYVQEMRLGNE
jgi:magnesium transporter